MKSTQSSSRGNSRGFTLIEVMLVLAIMGLIALLAFRAFREASINRRDNQRRNDSGFVLTRLLQYKEDNGDYPPNVVGANSAIPGPDGKYVIYDADIALYPDADTGEARRFYNEYLGGAAFKNGKGEPYGVMSGNDDDLAQHPDDVRYVKGYVCDANARSGISTNPDSVDNIAVQITLERGPLDDGSLPNRAAVCRDDTK